MRSYWFNFGCKSTGSTYLPFNEALLAAFQGDYAAANQWAIETERLRGTNRPGIYALQIYHETGEKERLRALVEKIDNWPAGAVIFWPLIRQYGYSLPFDLADAPKLSVKLEQAGIDLNLFSILPRVSTTE